MIRHAAIAALFSALTLTSCTTDRSAPLSEVEQRAIIRAQQPPPPVPVAQRPAPASTRREAPAKATTTSESEAEPEPTLEPAPVTQIAVEDPEIDIALPEPEPATGIAPPSYLAVAKIYNERIARLPRIWAVSTVGFEFTDENGSRRKEQGLGHIQFQRPHFLSLDIGKAGETLFWLGCDNDRFWVFDLQKNRTAHVGTHAALTRERAAELGLPALPTELPMLLGIAPLPTDANASIRAIEKGKAWRISLPPRNGVVTRLIVDPKKVWPTRVEQLNMSGELLLESDLAEYHQVKIAGEGGFFPQIAGRTRIFHAATDTLMIITLDDPVDDRKINPASFDYDILKTSLNAQHEVDVDQQIRGQLEAPGNWAP